MKNRKIVFYTGAGISKESGMPTFRGEGGLWDTLDVTAVADARNWYSGRRKTVGREDKLCWISSIL